MSRPITQKDGSKVYALNVATWLTRSQLRLGRRFTAAEGRAALRARSRGQGPHEYADEIKAAEPAPSTATAGGQLTTKPETCFVAIGLNAWGKGATRAEAIAIAKRNIPRSLIKPGSHALTVLEIVGHFRGVDGLGRVSYDGTLTEREPATVVIRKR